MFCFYLDQGYIKSEIELDAQLLWSKEIKSPFHNPIGFIVSQSRLWRKMWHIQPDAAITFLSRANVFGQLTAYMLDVPVRIASQRNPQFTYGKLTQRLDGFVGSRGIYTHNIMVSNAAKASFESNGARYMSYASAIVNGVSATASRLSQKAARDRFDLPHAPFLLVPSAGSLSKNNNTYL